MDVIERFNHCAKGTEYVGPPGGRRNRMYTSCVHMWKCTGGSVQLYTRSQFSFTIRGNNTYREKPCLTVDLRGVEVRLLCWIYCLFHITFTVVIKNWIRRRRGAALYEVQPMAGRGPCGAGPYGQIRIEFLYWKMFYAECRPGFIQFCIANCAKNCSSISLQLLVKLKIGLES